MLAAFTPGLAMTRYGGFRKLGVPFVGAPIINHNTLRGL